MISVLHEKFSDTFPDWLKKALARVNKINGYVRSRPRDVNILWDKAKYIKSTIPTSARTADMRDSNKLKVFKLVVPDFRGQKEIAVYIPGVLDPEINGKYVDMDAWYIPCSKIPYKKLVNVVDEFGYILIDKDNSNAVRAQRANARQGSVDRERSKGAHMARNYHNELQWYGPANGYDKSGYKLDPYKYVKMLAKLDVADSKAAARRIEGLYNQIEAVRMDVVKELSQTSKEINAKSGKWNSRMEDLSSAVQYISRAMREYESLLGTLDNINKEKGKEMSDKEREAMKSWYSHDLVRVSNNCKEYIKYAREYLNGTK